MVKSGGFITGVANILGLPEPTVTGAFRVLRVNGLMTTGARGVNAPEMTYMDAARMLIAMLVSERPAYAESGAKDFGSLVCTDFRSATELSPYLDRQVLEQVNAIATDFTFEERGLSERHSFEEALAEIIRMFGDDRNEEYWKRGQMIGHDGTIFEPQITIEVIPTELSARIFMQGNRYDYYDALVDHNDWEEHLSSEEYEAEQTANEAHELKKSRYSTAIKSVRSVETDQLVKLAELIRCVEEN